MIKYIDKNGNVAEIVKYYDGADTVEFRVNGEIEFMTWESFIKRFNSIVK